MKISPFSFNLGSAKVWKAKAWNKVWKTRSGLDIDIALNLDNQDIQSRLNKLKE